MFGILQILQILQILPKFASSQPACAAVDGGAPGEPGGPCEEGVYGRPWVKRYGLAGGYDAEEFPLRHPKAST